jgi:outer membrane protein OmpA-like peptidoglycan-associated protein
MRLKITLFVFCLFAAITIFADEPVVTSSEIEKALQQPKTRSLGRGVGVRAKVDLYIPFEFNSARLVPEAEAQLNELSNALGGDSLAAYHFEIAGHTDASGAADYNLSLSEMRAEVVMQYLLGHGVSPDRLKAVGYGEEKLLHKNRPMDAANRRVEIRNLGVATQ